MHYHSVNIFIHYFTRGTCMNKLLRFCISTTATCAAIACLPAHAVVVSYDFTAEVTRLVEILSEDGRPGNVNSSTWLGPTVTFGDKVTGRISYDSELSSQTSAGSAIFQNPSVRVSFNIMPSGIHYNQASTYLNTIQLRNGDQDEVMFINERSPDANGAANTVAFSLFGDNNMLSGNALPSNLSGAQWGLLRSYWNLGKESDYNQVELYAEILTLTPSVLPAVPEPASGAALLAGLGVLALAMRRRS
jgi:hypothetical protein